MMQTETHMGLTVEVADPNTVLVRLITRHRGLVNIVFVVRDGLAVVNPFLV